MDASSGRCLPQEAHLSRMFWMICQVSCSRYINCGCWWNAVSFLSTQLWRTLHFCHLWAFESTLPCVLSSHQQNPSLQTCGAMMMFSFAHTLASRLCDSCMCCVVCRCATCRTCPLVRPLPATPSTSFLGALVTPFFLALSSFSDWGKKDSFWQPSEISCPIRWGHSWPGYI